MAETLDSFPFRVPAGRYPWDSWTDGRIWRAKRPEDFSVAASSFSAYIRAKANELNKAVHVTIVENDTIVFQFYDKPD